MPAGGTKSEGSEGSERTRIRKNEDPKGGYVIQGKTDTASPEYKRAEEAGGIAASEDDVVDRTICIIEYSPAYDQLATKV